MSSPRRSPPPSCSWPATRRNRSTASSSASTAPSTEMIGRRVLLCFAAALLLGSAALAHAQTSESIRDPEAPSPRHEKTEVVRYRHMIVAANPLAADAGLAMLRAGGSAVDAAIAAELVLNL